MTSNGDETPPFSNLRHHQSPSQSQPHRPSPVLREDCWSEESTHALIEAWGSRHLSLNRGNLRQHHWQDVAADVNNHNNSSPTGRSKNLHRTDVQCKNRIDTLKKKYKVEKSKTLQSNGAYVSPWRFFSRLDFLISGDSPAKLPAPEKSLSSAPVSFPARFPVGPRSAKPKRPARVVGTFFQRGEVEEDSESEEVESEGTSSGGGRRGVGRRREKGGGRAGDGWRELAEAVRRFGEVYERVEVMKQEQMMELEKHRMQFAKDLEYQRMKLLMDTQLELARIKRSKLSDDADSYL